MKYKAFERSDFFGAALYLKSMFTIRGRNNLIRHEIERLHQSLREENARIEFLA